MSALERVKKLQQARALASLRAAHRSTAPHCAAAVAEDDTEAWYDARSHTMSDSSVAFISDAEREEVARLAAELESQERTAQQLTVVRELEPPTAACVPNPPLLFAERHWRYRPVDIRPFCFYWERDPMRSSPFPLPIDEQMKLNSLFQRTHQSIPGMWVSVMWGAAVVVAAVFCTVFGWHAYGPRTQGWFAIFPPPPPRFCAPSPPPCPLNLLQSSSAYFLVYTFTPIPILIAICSTSWTLFFSSQLREEGNQMLLHATPTLLAIPGIVNYTEYYNKDQSPASWTLRRDIKVGKTTGQMFMTEDGLLILRCVWYAAHMVMILHVVGVGTRRGCCRRHTPSGVTTYSALMMKYDYEFRPPNSPPPTAPAPVAQPAVCSHLACFQKQLSGLGRTTSGWRMAVQQL